MASPNNASRVAFEPVRTRAFGTITNAYAAVGTALIEPSRFMIFLNTTDSFVYFSIDGVNDHIPVPAGGDFTWDINSNRSDQAGIQTMATGTIIWVRAPIANPTVGSVYIATSYASN